MITHSLETYKINIGPISESLKQILKDSAYSARVVLMDTNTKQHCYPIMKEALGKHECIVIEPGEKQKNLETCRNIWDELMHLEIDRKGLMINLGGGVIGDMGGFCARTFKRGIDFLQIPTTLLSQVDASVGGKLGIDHNGVKNIVGLFHDPVGVLIDPTFLSTLSPSELRSGYAEIVKHGLIADAQLWEDTKSYDSNRSDWAEIISRSVAVKRRVVTIDQKEGGLRKILNFGHTIGHAIETYYLDGPKHLLHGEAVAIGMICEAYLAHKVAGLDIKDADAIKSNLLTIYGQQNIDDLSTSEMLRYMRNDKKNVGGAISFSLLDRIGSCTWDQNCSNQLIEESLEYYKSK